MSLEMINGLGVADVVDAMSMAFEHRAHDGVAHVDAADAVVQDALASCVDSMPGKDE